MHILWKQYKLSIEPLLYPAIAVVLVILHNYFKHYFISKQYHACNVNIVCVTLLEDASGLGKLEGVPLRHRCNAEKMLLV